MLGHSHRLGVGAALWFATVALGGPAAAEAQGAAGARPLVLPFSVVADPVATGSTGAAFWLGEAAAILLADELDVLGVSALSRADRVTAFARLQLPLSSTLTRATMIRVGELVHASEIVVGEVRLGTRLSVRARTIDLTAGRQSADVVEDGPLVEMFEIFERVAARLATLGARRADDTARPRARTHPPLEAFEQYVKGLVATASAAQERFLDAALKLAPGNDRIRVALWDVHTAQGAHEKALAVVQAVGSDAPLARHARFCAALSQTELRRFDEAYRALQQLHGEQPSPVLSNALGVIQLRRGGTPQTGVPTYFFTRAVDQESDNTDYLFNLGYAYAQARDSQAAVYWLREVVRFDPADGEAHLVMSQVLTAAGKTVEAQRELELARQLGAPLEAEPAAPAGRVSGGLERLTGRLDLRPTARVENAIANPAQREQQELAAFHLARGRRFVEQENDRDAVSELRRAIYLRPYDDEPHLLLGRVYQRAGQRREAVDAFRIALWCRETAEGRLRLGGALFEQGDREGARAEVQRALVLAPDSAEARELLKRIGDLGRLE